MLPTVQRYYQEREREGGGTYFIDTDWFAIQLNHIHDFYCIVSIIFAHKLNETVALMRLSDTITWYMYIHYTNIT